MIVRFNNTSAELVPENPQDQRVGLTVSAKFTAMAPGAQYTKLYKIKKWDGRVRLLNQHRYFSSGLVPHVVDMITELKCPVTIDDTRNINTISLQSPTVPVRDYQWSAITAAFQNTYEGTWWPRGILYMATGAGKTEVAAAMVQMANVPTLFLVHRKDLLFQTKDRFEKYGIKCGVLGDGQFDLQRVTVATMQTIAARIRKQADVSFLNGIEQIFFDEAHLLAASIDKGNLFTKIASMTPNAYMRWGLTATPFMRDKYSDWLLEGVTGKVLYQIKNKDLIDQNFLTAPKIHLIETKNVKGSMPGWPDCYEDGIVLNADRNWKILDIAAAANKPCLIFVTRTAHGDILVNEAKKRGMHIPFLSGEDSAVERKKQFDAMRAGKLSTLIISTIGDEGLDIPNIRSLVFAGAGKSQIKMLQRIGRGLRISANKDKVDVYDFKDESYPILKRHSQARLKVWKDEGFEVS